MSAEQSQSFLPEEDMGSLIRSRDWSKTPLGPIDHWSETFSSLLSTIMEIKLPILICWGEQLINIYNDAYRPPARQKPKRAGTTIS